MTNYNYQSKSGILTGTGPSKVLSKSKSVVFESTVLENEFYQESPIKQQKPNRLTDAASIITPTNKKYLSHGKSQQSRGGAEDCENDASLASFSGRKQSWRRPSVLKHHY